MNRHIYSSIREKNNQQRIKELDRLYTLAGILFFISFLIYLMARISILVSSNFYNLQNG